MIERGAVEVNGTVVTRLPIFVDPATDRVVVDGQLLKLRRTAEASRRNDRVYIMLNKPDRVLCTTRDEAEGGGGAGSRTTVLDLIHDRSGARLYPVGRLDYHSTGLVLLTNDGALADRLTHARYGVTRTYRVTIKGHIRPDMLDDLRRRVGKPDTLATDAAGSDARDDGGVRVAREPGEESSTTTLEVTLREGKSRQLSAILEQMGCLVRKLIRTGIGPLRMFGVAIGQSRNLTRDEVHALMFAGGLTPHPPAPERPTGPRARATNRDGQPSRPRKRPGTSRKEGGKPPPDTRRPRPPRGKPGASGGKGGGAGSKPRGGRRP